MSSYQAEYFGQQFPSTMKSNKNFFMFTFHAGNSSLQHLWDDWQQSNDKWKRKADLIIIFHIITRLINSRQHTPQRAWDNWHTDAGGSNQLTGYSVQLLVVKHHRHCADKRQSKPSEWQGSMKIRIIYILYKFKAESISQLITVD